MDYNAHEVSIVLTDDDEIQRLNDSFRGINRPTNVLSFAMQEGRFGDINPGLLGDVVISCDTAAREADDAGITLSERLTQLLIHGILHLVGFDHETSEKEAQEMEHKSLALLKQIESNPDLKAF